jgi:putative ABC transport system substrate-binding protein
MNGQHLTPRILSRRRFLQGAGLASLGLLVGCGSLPFSAAQPAKIPRVGFLATDPEVTDRVTTEAVRAGLRELGYVEGQSLVVEYRYAENQPERHLDLAAELVRLPVDLMIGQGARAALAAKQATATIPIVMASGGSDPMALGLVQSLARPGGNVTGVAQGLLGSKRLGLLKDVVPGLERVAVLWHSTAPLAATNLAELHEAGQKVGIQVQPVEVRDADVESAIDTATREQARGLIVIQGPLLSIRVQLADLALQRGLPTMYPIKDYVQAGGLMAYSPSEEDIGRRAAYYVDRILKGAEPADLPVEQPTRFDFVINLQTAQALGLTIPPHVLLQATQVIQ